MGKKSRRKRESKRDGLSLSISNDTHAQRTASIERPFAQVSVLVILVSLFLILATLVVYWQVRNHDFLNFDDDVYVTKNPHVQAGLTWDGAIWAFTTTHASNWHPLTWLSHMLDCQLYGLNPSGHHFTNLLLHIANTLLLVMVLNRMTGAFWRSAFVAALFALHPLHVESVVWVAERKDVLSTFFWITTMWAYVRYIERPEFRRYLLVILSFALGLMAKPMLVTLPFVLLLMDYWPLGRFQFSYGDPRPQKSMNLSHKKPLILHLVWEKAPLFALAAASCVVTFLAQEAGGAVMSLDVSPLQIRVANALAAYMSYIGKMIWPFFLAAFYPHPGMLPIWQVVGASFLLVSISVLVIRAAPRSPYLAVGWLWYLGTLVPVIGLVQVGSHAIADRYTYVPLIGLFIGFTWGVADLVARWRYRRSVLTISTGVLLLALMVCTWLQVSHWRNSIVLFKHTLDVTTNNCLAHYNLGVALLHQGKLEQAISHYSKAVQIKPDYSEAHNNLGLALERQGKLEQAISHYSKAVEAWPDNAQAQNNLGAALARLGRFEEAISHYSKALQIKRDFAEADFNLGLALERQGRLEEAIRHYSKAVQIRPDYVKAHHNLGVALLRQGRLEEAIRQLSKALQIKPDHVEMRYNLGVALLRQGRLEEAIRQLSDVLRIRPDFPEAQSILKRSKRALWQGQEREEAWTPFTGQ